MRFCRVVGLRAHADREGRVALAAGRRGVCLPRRPVLPADLQNRPRRVPPLTGTPSPAPEA